MAYYLIFLRVCTQYCQKCQNRLFKAYVLFGGDLVLTLEYAVHDVTACQVKSIADWYFGTNATVELLYAAII